MSEAMDATYRPIVAPDIDALFVLRSSVRENPFSVAQLAAMGITPASVAQALGRNLDGVLCEVSGVLAGFAMADVITGEFSVIAVLSVYERGGIGRELLRRTEEILWEAGHQLIWLWTGADRNTRAWRLYSRAGWVETEVKDERIYMRKNRSSS